MKNNIIIDKMSIDDLDSIKSVLQDEFDDFWNYNVFKEELKNENSYYIIAKLEDNIVGFGGIWKAVDDVHITNIVVKKSIPEADIDKMKPRTSYIPLELEDFDLEEGRSYLRVRDEIYKRINVVIHIMNFMSKNKTRGVMYEIYDYMRGVVEDYERLLKLNIL